MKLSTDRILTTHVGSLPRPAPLFDLLEARNKGENFDQEALEAKTTEAVADIVAQQMANGIDVVSDGEMSKISYTFYVKHRLKGIGEVGPPGTLPGSRTRAAETQKEHLEFPDFYEQARAVRGTGFVGVSFPNCIGPIEYGDHGPLEADLGNYGVAVEKSKPAEAFLNAASPGVLTRFVPNAYYKNEDAYLEALAAAMKVEYEAIHRAGFLLQIDCPDLASARHSQYQDKSDAEFVKIAERNIEALNVATANIPAEAMRMHVCWGNYEGPHVYDIGMGTMIGTYLKARPMAILFEGANPRHEHEWEDLEEAKIPDDKVLIPGVIDSVTNFVEHPRLIAQRICRYAGIVGRERVLAGSDCGFATFAGRNPRIAPSVVWAKFRSMEEGARIATERLWK